jgi:hypothetical protein
MSEPTLTEMLLARGFTHRAPVGPLPRGARAYSREILSGGEVVFAGDYMQVREWLAAMGAPAVGEQLDLWSGQGREE